MKKKCLALALIGLMLIIPNICRAEDIVNQNGVVMTEEEYNNFLKIHSEGYIMTMDEEKYEKLKTLDYNNVTRDTKYLETLYNPHLNLETNREITEEEYENSLIMPILDSHSAYSEISTRKVVLSLASGTTWNYVSLDVDWTYIPGSRTFDVIGIRGYGLGFRNGSQYGEQIYKENGEWKYISYDWDGERINRFDNGFGFAMNLVNSKDITVLQLIAECDVKVLENHPSLYGSHQHSTKSISLNEAMNYTIGLGGLGNVFVFPYEVRQKYDGMTGPLINY